MGENRKMGGRLDRRSFMELAALNSLALAQASSSKAFAAEPVRRSLALPKFARFGELVPGSIVPGGWLKTYLSKQARQLTGNLPDVSEPFSEAFWAGKEDAPARDGWWGWEQKGYWIDGALRCALLLRDPGLLKKALAPINFTLNHVAANGYLGPAYLADPRRVPAISEPRWPHAVFFRALAAQAAATSDPRVAEAMRRHYEADQPNLADYHLTRSVVHAESMCWAYQQTGDSGLLRSAELIWERFQEHYAPDDVSGNDLNPERVLGRTAIRSHGIGYTEKAKLPAILYMHTGKAEYLDFAIAAHERIDLHHMLISGLPSSAEEFWDRSPLDAHETCIISDLTWNWGYLLMATGDGKWADRIERAVFNAGLGAIKKDWKAVQYFSSPNQVIATANSSHVHYGHGKLTEGWMAYRPNPGHITACCGGNVHRFLPNYVMRSWMRDPNGGLAAVLYGASTVEAEVGDGQTIQIVQETNYPFEEDIHFTIKTKRPVAFPFSFRIPAFCKTPELRINGQPAKLPPVSKGFVRLDRVFQPGDKISLKLPMHVELSRWRGFWTENAIGIEHGPLVFALDIDEKWTASVAPKWSTADFPEWDLQAASPWNFSCITFDQVKSNLEIIRGPMTADPWIDPPTQMKLEMVRIPGWDLVTDPHNAARRETPPLPEPWKYLPSDIPIKPEVVTLIPYGATHLRLSIFSALA